MEFGASPPVAQRAPDWLSCVFFIDLCGEPPHTQIPVVLTYDALLFGEAGAEPGNTTPGDDFGRSGLNSDFEGV